MLRVYLSCSHVYEIGCLTVEEEATKTTLCPVCRKIAKISKVVRLTHPPNSKKKWVEEI